MADTLYKYFATSDRDRAWGLFVLNYGTSHIPAHAEYPPSKHPAHHYFNWKTGRVLQEFQLFYLIEGQGILETAATGRIEVKAGHLVVLFPDVWHRYRPLKTSVWHTHWTGFDGPFARHLLSQDFFRPAKPVLDIGHQAAVLHLFMEIQRIGKQEVAGYQHILSGILLRLLGEIHSCLQRKDFVSRGQEDLMQRAKTLLVESISQPVQMENIAAKLSMSYSLFRKLFKKYTGLSPNQYLIQLRIERAKYILSNTDIRTKDIAEQLGFDSIYYFTRIFTSKTGESPGRFRKKAVERARRG